jgi:hypothetical protein
VLSETLMAAAAAGGVAVAQAMATDSWETVKKGFAAVLGRGNPAREAAAAERLEQSAAEATAIAYADPVEARATQAAMWQGRLESVLEDEPHYAAQVWDLVELVRAQATGGSAVTVNAEARDRARMAVQGHGIQHNDFGSPDNGSPDKSVR